MKLLDKARVLRGAIAQTSQPTKFRGPVRQILLTNVPRTATPKDIRREITKAGVQGVCDIALDYNYFNPTERAILTLVNSDYITPNLKKLENLTISGIPIRARSRKSSDTAISDTNNSAKPPRTRMRGFEGRVQAAARGALDGTGPNAGVPNNERTVVMTGLPVRTKMEDLATLLKDFKLAYSSKGLPQIIKVPLPPNTFSVSSNFVITLDSVSEAHRLVRTMHASYISVYGGDSLISAKIIY